MPGSSLQLDAPLQGSKKLQNRSSKIQARGARQPTRQPSRLNPAVSSRETPGVAAVAAPDQLPSEAQPARSTQNGDKPLSQEGLCIGNSRGTGTGKAQAGQPGPRHAASAGAPSADKACDGQQMPDSISQPADAKRSRLASKVML